MVETVLGPIDTAQLGFTLMHEHIVLQTIGLRDNWPETFDRPFVVRRGVEKLAAARAAGVDTIVDLTTMDNGRDVPLIEEIVKQVGMQVIVCTGLWRNVPRYFEARSPDVLAECFVRDINDGVQGTAIKAGIIKVASDAREIGGPLELSFRAAARAHRQTGVPISTHTDSATHAGLDQQRLLAEEGVDLTRVTIGHSGDTEDFDYLERLLDRGSYLGMDRFGLDHIWGQRLLTTEQRVRVVAEMCRRGHAERLVLSHDTNCFSDHREPSVQEQTWPNWHHAHISRDVLPALRDAGVSQRQIDQMTRDNPQAIFRQQGPY